MPRKLPDPRAIPGMLFPMRALVLLALAAVPASAAPGLVAQSDPHPGIHRETWVDPAIPARIHLVRIDLTSAEIALYATKESDRGQTTSGFADLLSAQVAINGDAFSVSGYRPRGFAMGDSAAWSNTADDISTALLHFGRAGERSYVTIEPPETVLDSTTVPPGTQGAIAGRPLLVRAGTVESQFDCNDPVTLSCSRAPRTAVAVSQNGNTMWLAVVSGWQAGSLGMTAAELATFLRARGAFAAVALDGGSSSTLVIDGSVVNAPSDGIERTVANHLGIKYGALPKGSMVGFICKVADIPACGQDPALRVTGVSIKLDDGRVVTSTDGFYSFAGITPRLACATVKKAGYQTRVACKTVSSGVQTYNSVFLEPGVDLPDAGVRDAGGEEIDAGETGDGGVRPDAGFPGTGDGGGCCDAGGDLGGPRTHLLLVALVAWSLTRRRVTKAAG